MEKHNTIKSALIIGGCGSLGHRLVEGLLKLEPQPRISVFDLKATQNRYPGVDYYDLDIANKDQVVGTLLKVQPEVIFHTASPPPSLSDLPLYLKVNVKGTGNLIEAAKESKVKAFVYTSSASVVHDSVSDLIDGDDTLPLLYMPKQHEIYSHTKAIADQLVLNSNSKVKGGLLTTCLRPSGIFGEGTDTAKSFIERAAAGKMNIQMGNGKNLFDFTFIDNVVHAHILAAQALLRSRIQPLPDDMRVAGEGFIITNDEPILFWKFGRSLGNAAGFPTKEEDVRSIPKFVGLAVAMIAEWFVWIVSFGRSKSRVTRVAIRYSCINRTYKIDKAKKALGYKPLVGMQEGIERTGKWFATRMEPKKTI